MYCKNSNKAVAWSMTRIAPFGQALCRLSVWSSMGVMVSFHYLPIIDMNPTGLNCIYIQHCGSPRMYILVKLGGFHAIMNGLDATGYIMAGFGFRRASDGNPCSKHYSTHHVWPVTIVHSGPALSSLQPSITTLPQPPAP